MGGTKAGGNYSPVLFTQLEAKKQGFADVCYLDALTNSNLEEVSSCNIFVVRGKTVSTPPLTGTILPGVTRRSVMKLLEDAGYDVREEQVPVTEACQADEVFTTGTAVVVSSVGSLTYEGAPLFPLSAWVVRPREHPLMRVSRCRRSRLVSRDGQQI